MTSNSLRLSCLLLVLVWPFAAQAQTDLPATVVAEQVLEAMGGPQAWESTRYLSFGFAEARTHLWDRHTGNHRLQGETADGESYLVLHNLADQGQGSGQVFIDGSPEEAEEIKAKFLTRAYGAWVNDTYWLLMPYKLLDPGVELQHLGTVTLDGNDYTKIGLSFGEVGLTPGDRYWAYVDQTSNLVTRWEYILENQEPDSAPTTWTWDNWQRHGQILLSDTRTELSDDGTDRVLSLAPIQVLDNVDSSLFEAP